MSIPRMEVSSPIREKIEAISEDIIFELLLRLPVKTLLRFKLVCKTWRNLIISQKFKSMHHTLGAVSQTLISVRKKPEEEGGSFAMCFHSNDKLMSEVSPDLEIPTIGNLVVVVGSCNGIVCYYDRSSTIFLSNPATREFRQLPPSSFRFEKSGLRFPEFKVGFGFDSSNIYDFKVISVFFVDKEIKAEMFTLSSNTWRQLQCGHLSGALGGYVLFCANSFHFLIQKPGDSDVGQRAIACYDIRTELFNTLDFPPKPQDDEGSFGMLMTFKGYLSSVYSYSLPMNMLEEKSMDIWVMKDYGVVDSWTKLYRIRLPVAMALCFWMDGHHLLILHYIMRKLVTCHLNSLDRILDVESIETSRWFLRVVVYKETLVSLM